MTLGRAAAWLVPAALMAVPCSGAEIAVGSKKFTESVVLGEILCQLVRDAGEDVVHRAELGGTRILWSALLSGEIDVYPEYTGTIRQEILAGELSPDADLAAALAARGVLISAPLGFDNTYALGMAGASARSRAGARPRSTCPP
jgi:osmoprotectant transport system permease protein